MKKKLSECKKACVVRVTKLNADAELKQRLISFGVMKDVIVEVLEYAPAKSTIEIKVGNTRLALRAKEADLIEVEKI
ncbi:FeoA [Sulfurimonas denitrificans DSM 1251]|uniref:FeoA n=1 Tax=Sulfurimonas denitrificans (strain ATCC 33889 / DSM 1251) TaxID=326298 RepID=Q30PP5_SULDN|nr:FeoA family protein [Sulfurimonas denitrificans]ABB45036.1 FeoA [Sulfurimonas denitrificans DSM 1251]MDD3442206.1 FeoA family protein [Sulfurimonas denitrificans]